MGYYTKLAYTFMGEDDDYSFPSPERELFWRLDDLESRLEELSSKKTCQERHLVVHDDIRYALPEHLVTVYEVKRAIEVAKDDLRNKYGITFEAVIGQVNPEHEKEIPDEEYEQISFIGLFMQIINHSDRQVA